MNFNATLYKSYIKVAHMVERHNLEFVEIIPKIDPQFLCVGRSEFKYNHVQENTSLPDIRFSKF